SIVEVEPVPGEEWHEPVHCVVEKMLVVNSVKLALLDHVDSVCAFEYRHALRLQQPFEASDEVIDRIDMGDHVVGDHEDGDLSLLCQSSRKFQGKEVVYDWNTESASALGGARCRVDAQARHAALHEISKQVTVVRRDLDDQAVRTKAQVLHQTRSIG